MNTHSDFASRHIGPQGEERREMLDSLGYRTLDELIADIVPADIRMKARWTCPQPNRKRKPWRNSVPSCGKTSS